jgi:hypothetical protein
MAYDKKDLETKALAAIKKHKLIFIEEVCSFLPCSEKTFRNHKLQDLPTIKDALNANKINTKAKLRKKWANMENAALNVALYKLCASDEEIDKLSTNKTKITDGNGDPFKIILVDASKSGNDKKD